jgi:hypothetical protein
MFRRNLGPGSENLLPLLQSPDLPVDRRIDPMKQVREFDTQDWANIVQVFKNWRFAPEVSLGLGRLKGIGFSVLSRNVG